jgi:hypothetical protein
MTPGVHTAHGRRTSTHTRRFGSNPAFLPAEPVSSHFLSFQSFQTDQVFTAGGRAQKSGQGSANSKAISLSDNPASPTRQNE